MSTRGSRRARADLSEELHRLEVLDQGIRTLHVGSGLVFPDATRALITDHHWQGDRRRRAPDSEAAFALEQLSNRERQVVELLGNGLSNDEIAATLFVGMATVKTHINRCFAKLGVRDRAQMVVLAYETGVVSLG